MQVLFLPPPFLFSAQAFNKLLNKKLYPILSLRFFSYIQICTAPLKASTAFVATKLTAMHMTIIASSIAILIIEITVSSATDAITRVLPIS